MTKTHNISEVPIYLKLKVLLRKVYLIYSELSSCRSFLKFTLTMNSIKLMWMKTQ